MSLRVNEHGCGIPISRPGPSARVVWRESRRVGYPPGAFVPRVSPATLGWIEAGFTTQNPFWAQYRSARIVLAKALADQFRPCVSCQYKILRFSPNWTCALWVF